MKNDIGLLFDAAVKRIQEVAKIFEKMEENPELIITTLFRPHIHAPFYEIPFEAFKQAKDLIGKEIGYHHAQKYLVEQLQRFFAQLDPELELALSSLNHYGSSVRVAYQGYELFRFNFYEHWFSDCSRRFDYEKQAEGHHDMVRALEVLVEEMKKDLENPARRFPNWFIRMRYRKQMPEIVKRLEKRIQAEEARLQKERETEERIRARKKEREEKETEIQAKCEFLRKKFAEWGYEEKEKNTFS